MYFWKKFAAVFLVIVALLFAHHSSLWGHPDLVINNPLAGLEAGLHDADGTHSLTTPDLLVSWDNFGPGFSNKGVRLCNDDGEAWSTTAQFNLQFVQPVSFYHITVYDLDTEKFTDRNGAVIPPPQL